MNGLIDRISERNGIALKIYRQLLTIFFGHTLSNLLKAAQARKVLYPTFFGMDKIFCFTEFHLALRAQKDGLFDSIGNLL